MTRTHTRTVHPGKMGPSLPRCRLPKGSTETVRLFASSYHTELAGLTARSPCLKKNGAQKSEDRPAVPLQARLQHWPSPGERVWVCAGKNGGYQWSLRHAVVCLTNKTACMRGSVWNCVGQFSWLLSFSRICRSLLSESSKAISCQPSPSRHIARD